VEQTFAVVIFSWAPSSSSVNHHPALISDTFDHQQKEKQQQQQHVP
jgi:hypothetical protein